MKLDFETSWSLWALGAGIAFVVTAKYGWINRILDNRFLAVLFLPFKIIEVLGGRSAVDAYLVVIGIGLVIAGVAGLVFGLL